MEVQMQPLDLSLRSSTIRSSVGYAVSEHLARLYQRTLSGCNEKAVGAGGTGTSTRTGVKNVLPCQVCLKTFDRPSLLKRHMRTHTGEKPHVCGVCRKGFSTSSSLNTHRRIHTGEKPHKCAECGKCFTASSNLYYHRMTHTKNKPHKCSMCPRSFPTPGDLRAHRPVHGGAWPHMCPLCARGFAKHTNLKHHLRLHSTGASSSQLLYTSHGKDIAAILETLRLLKGPSLEQSPESASASAHAHLASYDLV